MQKSGHWLTVILGCLAGFLALPAHAQDAVIVVTMVGEAYKGAPKFRFIADDLIIGAGEISSAVDARKGENLKLGEGAKQPSSERFLFTVPNIDKVSRLDIQFINDAWAGKGQPGDRNLYVLALSLSTVEKTQTGSIVTSREFPPRAFEALTKMRQGASISTKYAALYQQGRLRLNRPAAGWAAGAAANEPKEAASTTEPACTLKPLELKGFEKNTAQLSQGMREQIAALGKALKGSSCTARITAFTGGGSSEAFRAKLSEARAKEVAAELAKLGLASERILTEAAAGSGRRVVISFN